MLIKWSAPLAAVVLVGCLLVGGTTAQDTDRSRPPDERLRLVTNIGLTGTATATSWQSAATPDKAIDGNARTGWCASQWTGTLTVDLGRTRELSGFGLTLLGTDQTGEVAISFATNTNDWKPLGAAQHIPVAPNEPIYLPALVSARFAQLSV